MKNLIYPLFAVLLVLVSCKDDTERLFEQSAEARAAEAKQNLKNELVSVENGWRIKYKPEEASGSYWVLLHFFEDNKLVIESDLGARDGEFFTDTLSYRIDNSLGLELIFETYSFFSYLFERDQATFLAEYEFIYVNKTPDGSLVFQSKSDPQGSKTNLVFEPASAGDRVLLGTTVSTNINQLADDIGGLVFSSPSYQLTYQSRDLAFFMALDEVRRTITITSAARTSNGASQPVNFSTGYHLQGDSLIFAEPLTGTFINYTVNLKSILFTKLTTQTTEVCGGLEVHSYEGITSQNDVVNLQATLSSPEGATFADSYSFLYSPIQYIVNNGESATEALAADLTGVHSMQLYLQASGTVGLGFFVQNADGTNTWAIWEGELIINGNNLAFTFNPTYTIYGNTNTQANLDNITSYINAFTEGNQTYMFKIQDGIYEMSNPCTGWTAAFFGVQ